MNHILKICLILATTLAIVLGLTETTLHGTTTTEGSTTITPCNCACEREAVLLHEIKELTFVKGASTLSRRQPAIQQLECVGGSAKGTSEPNVVRCVNVGHLEPHWRCETTADVSVQLGAVTVSCEGYMGPHDPYVLRGSCGLLYNWEYASWGPYLWGNFVRALTIMVWTPIKWLSGIAIGLLIGLVALAIIRRPTRRNRLAPSRGNLQRTQEEVPEHRGWSSWEDKSQLEYEVEGEGVDSVWTGRLRPRKRDVPSPTGLVGAGTR